jgi:hypothetical protein
VAVDPFASLGPTDLEVEVAGQDFLIPAAPAAVWLRVFLAAEPNVDMILPGMAGPECRAHLYRALLSGEFTVAEWKQLIWDIIEVTAGRRWWQALNLINGMKEPGTWEQVFGHLMLRGLDIERVSLAAWLDATYALCTEHMDREEKIKFQLAINTVPDEVSPEDAIDEAEQERAFLALMQAVKSTG